MDSLKIIKIIHWILLILGVLGIVLLVLSGALALPGWTLYLSIGMLICGIFGILGLLDDSDDEPDDQTKHDPDKDNPYLKPKDVDRYIATKR